MLRTTSAIRESPPSSKRKTVGSTSRTRYVAKMKAEVTSRISETNSVSVPTGIKTLNRRIIEGPGTRITARLIILGIAGHPNRWNCRDENHLSRLSRHHAGGSACPGRDASFFWGEIRQCRQRYAQLRMGGGGGGGSGAPADRGPGGGGRARDRVHQRRHGVGQSGAEGRGGGRRRRAGGYRDPCHGAQSGAGYGKPARGGGLPGDDSGPEAGRTGGPRSVARGHRAGDGFGERDVRQQ